MKQIRFLVILLLTAGFSSCVSMSSLQTAKTLKKDEDQQSFGGGVYNSKMNVGNVETDTNLPYLEYSYRRGFAENFDAGLKLTFVGAYAADGKYQIYTNDKFTFSAGAGLGYLSYKVTVGDQEQNYKFLDFMLPIYLSYEFSPSFTIYTSPKYIVRKISGASSDTEKITGLTLGTKIGEKSGVYAEASLIKGEDSNNITQYNLSYFW